MLEAEDDDRRRHPDERADRARGAPRPLLGRPPDGGRLAVPARARPRARTGSSGAGRRSTSRTRSTTAPRRRCCARSSDTAAGLGADGRALAAAVRLARPPGSTSSTRTSCGRSSTCRATRCGWRASGSRRRRPRRCSRGASRTERGAGAVRRRRRARVQPAQPADELVGRDGADLRLPPLRLAGRARRLAGDHRRARRGRAASTAGRSRPAAGSTSLDELPRRRRGDARPRARRRSPRSPATGCRAGSRAPTAATGTGRAPSRSTSRSRAGCPGRTRRAAAPGTVHAVGSFEEIVAAEREVNRGRMPERPFVLVCQQYLADPSRSDGDVHPVWAYAHVPERLRRRRDRGDPRPDRALRPGAARADRRPRRRARRPRSPPTTPTTSAATSSPAPTPRSRSLFRPRVRRSIPYATGIPGVYICSAATPAGRRRPRDERLQRRALGAAPHRTHQFLVAASDRRQGG